MTLPIDQIVAELNNIGVSFHEANQLDKASSIYLDATRALSGLLDVPQADADGHEEQDKFRVKWQAKLMEWSEKAQGSNTCYVDSGPKTTFIFHVVAPYGQDISSFTKAHRIDINQVSRELASVIIIYNIALVNIQKGALEESLKLFQSMLSLIPNEFDQMSTSMSLLCIAAQYNLGLLLNELGGKNDAIEVLVGAAELGGALLGDHVVVANTLNALGQLMSQEGNTRQAMEVFHMVARIYDRYDIGTAELSHQQDCMDDSLAPAA